MAREKKLIWARGGVDMGSQMVQGGQVKVGTWQRVEKWIWAGAGVDMGRWRREKGIWAGG